MPTDYDDTKRRSWDRALDATPLRHANFPKETLRMKGTPLMGLSSTGFLVLWSPQSGCRMANAGGHMGRKQIPVRNGCRRSGVRRADEHGIRPHVQARQTQPELATWQAIKS